MTMRVWQPQRSEGENREDAKAAKRDAKRRFLRAISAALASSRFKLTPRFSWQAVPTVKPLNS
jgi:hypothetical protein